MDKIIPKWYIDDELKNDLKNMHGIDIQHEVLGAMVQEDQVPIAAFTEKEYKDFITDTVDRNRDILIGAEVILIKQDDGMIRVENYKKEVQDTITQAEAEEKYFVDFI